MEVAATQFEKSRQDRRRALACLAASPLLLHQAKGGEPQAVRSTTALKLETSLSAAADWLTRQQRSDGLFEYGLTPCVNRPLDEENLLRQAGTAYAMACMAAKHPRHVASADRAIAGLLALTKSDGQRPARRFGLRPPEEANPVGFASLLLMAIATRNESSPTEERRRVAMELANFLLGRQFEDGSIDFGNSIEPDGPAPAAGIDYYPGEALYAIALSMRDAPTAHKADWLERSRPFYQRHFSDGGSLAFIPWQLQAFAEKFIRTKQRADRDFAFALADRLLAFQYAADRRPPDAEWSGGFAGCDGGAFVPWPPGIATASYAEGLAAAAHAARAAGDHRRHATYRTALTAAVQFLTKLQFDNLNTLHFAADFRPRVVGAFHAGLADGNVRIDFNQHAICAMLGLEKVESAPARADLREATQIPAKSGKR